MVVPNLSDIGRDGLEWSGGFVANKEIGATGQVTEDLSDPRDFVLSGDPREGQSPPIEEFPQGISADIDFVFSQQFGLNPLHSVFRVFGEDGLNLSFEAQIFIRHPLFGVNGDVIGTLGDPQESTDPINSKES